LKASCREQKVLPDNNLGRRRRRRRDSRTVVSKKKNSIAMSTYDGCEQEERGEKKE
jgi:hypothetical protein